MEIKFSIKDKYLNFSGSFPIVVDLNNLKYDETTKNFYGESHKRDY